MANGRDGRPPRRRPEQPADRDGGARQRPERPAEDRRRRTPPPGTRRRRPQPADPRQRPAARPERTADAARRRERPRRRRGGSVLLHLVATLLVVAVFLVCVAIFFRVREIQVRGNAIYTADQVIEASGLQTGDNLVTIRRGPTAARIMAALPYVESAQVERVLPDTVVLTVTESDAVYLVTAEDGTGWLMNSAGRMLEQADVTAASYPRLTGVTAQAPEAGAQIVTEETSSLAAAQAVMELLESTDFLAEIVEIDVTRSYDIVLWYGTRFEIHLGTTDQLDYKLRYLTAILESGQLESSQVSEGGVIDLTLEENNVAGFRPWSSTQNFTGENSEDSGTSS